MSPRGPRFIFTPRVTRERHLVTRSGVQALRWRRDGEEMF
jgi:hypothetical protein